MGEKEGGQEMNDYKFEVGQYVTFFDTKTRTRKEGTIIERWWYESQGFRGWPMYDIDYGGSETALGVDEDGILAKPSSTHTNLSLRGRAQLKEILSEKRAELRVLRNSVIKKRQEIKTILDRLAPTSKGVTNGCAKVQDRR